MFLNKKYHLNDISFKYKVMSQLKRLHQFLDLPGEFKIRYPQEVVFPNLESGRMDEIYLTSLDILIILEEESDYISNETLEKFAKYIFFARYMYYKEIHLAVLCHKNPGKEFICFRDSSSIFIKIHFIYFSQDDLMGKYENIIMALAAINLF